MKTVSASIAAAGALIVYAGGLQGPQPALDTRDAGVAHSVDVIEGSANELLEQYCVRCHNERRCGATCRLRASTSPHPRRRGTRREDHPQAPGGHDAPGRRVAPEGRTLAPWPPGSRSDSTARGGDPNPGRRTFQRLNRAEYEASIRDLLGLDIDAGDYLPLDTKSANFDNIADVQMLSATVLRATCAPPLRSAASRWATPTRQPTDATYQDPADGSQGAGRRRAVRARAAVSSVVHNFPADGEYRLRPFHHGPRVRRRERPFGPAHRRGVRADRDLDRRRAGRAARDRPLDEQRRIRTG